MSNVGYATLQVIPSARNFGRNLRKEVSGDLTGVGRDAGTTFGSSFSTAVHKETSSGAKRSGAGFVSGFGETITTGLGGVLRSAFTSLPVAGIAAGFAAALSSAIGAAVSTGIVFAVGAGVLAAGITAAARDPAVGKAFEGFGATAKKALRGFVEPFKAPLIRSAQTFGDAMKRLEPSFARLGQLAAPLIDKLAPGLAGMAENAMPGFVRAVGAAVPIFERLAARMPELGSAISRFFDIVAANGPLIERFFNGMLTGLINGIPMAAQLLASLTSRFFLIVDAVQLVASKVGPVFEFIRTGVQNFLAAFTNSAAVTQFGTFLTSLVEPLRNLGGAFQSIGASIAAAWTTQIQPFLVKIGELFAPVWIQLQSTIQTVLTNLTPILTGLGNIFGFFWNTLGLGQVILDAVKGSFGALATIITGAFQIISGVFQFFGGLLSLDWSTMWNGVKAIGEGIWNMICGAFQAVIVGGLGGLVRGILANIGGWFAEKFNQIVGLAGNWVNGILGWASNLGSSLTGKVSSMVSSVVNWFAGLPGKTASVISGGVGRIVSAIGEWGTGMLGSLKELPGKFISIAGDLINGFIQGIKNGASRIISAIKSSITDLIPGFVKDALGINSPSRVFAGLGLNVAQGMALGITKGSRKVTKAVGALTDIPDSTVTAEGQARAALLGARAGAALVGSLTLNSHGGNTRDQLDEALFALRRIRRGGVYA